MDKCDYDQAILWYQKAISCLPTSQQDYEGYIRLKASLGDAYYQKEDYLNAKEQFYDALNGPDGHQNRFILLRLGQVLYNLNDSKAIEFLMRAYMLEGESIFNDENPIYLSLVQQTSC